MKVKIHWVDITKDDISELWNMNFGLYAYYKPDDDEILYIGKVDGTTVRQRWNRPAKANFWNDIEKQRGIFEHGILVGILELEAGKNRTSSLLSFVESLLIFEMEPWGNIQCQKSRTTCPGLEVHCKGDWICDECYFIDK